MSSKVAICNMALSRLGAANITSLTDGTESAKLCNTFFDILVDRAIIQGSWTTAIRRAELARKITTPTFGYAYEFQLPVDPFCLKVLNINDDSRTLRYTIESGNLLTDESSVKIRYLARLTNTEDFGAALTEAVEVLLASYLAGPLTSDPNLPRALKQEYLELISRNLTIDGQQGSKQYAIVDDLVSVRN